MLFDYIKYRFKLGRFSDDIRAWPICFSWEGDFQPVLLELLEPFDLIFFQNRNSFLSWLVLYITKTDISHCGTYIGDGKVLHATLSGTVKTDLKWFFDIGCRVMPVHMSAQSKQRKEIDISDLIGKPYDKWGTLAKGIKAIIGINWPKFRATYLWDVSCVLIVLDVLLFLSTGLLAFWLILACYYIIVLYAYLSKNKRKYLIDNPGDGFYAVVRDQGKLIPSPLKVNQRWIIEQIKKVASGSQSNGQASIL